MPRGETDRSQAEEKIEDFPSGEVSCLDTVDPAIVEPRLRGHAKTPLPLADHQAEHQGRPGHHGPVIQANREIQMSPLVPECSKGGHAVEELPLEVLESSR